LDKSEVATSGEIERSQRFWSAVRRLGSKCVTLREH
jgi:hypothetical protein